MCPGPEAGARGGNPGRVARILQNIALDAPSVGGPWHSFPLVAAMQSPLVVCALRDQLLQVLDWYRLGLQRFEWGAVIHRRNERGKLRFGAITPQGESLLLSEPMLEELAGTACWLDGAVRVRLENRRISDPHPWLDALARPNRPPLVEALAVYFDPDTCPEEAVAFQQMAGVLTPAKCPTELFLLTRHKPSGWPA
jgi:hypothetical protein